MKVTLDVDPTALGTEVSKFIETLTPEDKNAMVKQALTQYYSDFRQFEDGEFAVKEKEVIEKIRQNASSYEKQRFSTDEGVRASSDYLAAKKNFRTFSERTREEISETLRSELRNQIQKFVAEDPGYQQLLKESMETVKAQFPQMVQIAMITHFSSQLPNLQNQIAEMTSEMYNRVSNVEQRLLR